MKPTAAFSWIFLLASTLMAQNGDHRSAAPSSPNDAVRLNVPLPTGGGIQLWTDHRVREGNRMQQNALTRHWRVVDAKGIRRAWGNHDDCLAALDGLKTWSDDDDDGRTVTVLLHGLMRTRHSMKKLGGQLDAHGGSVPVTFGYASTRAGLPDHAKAFQNVISDWPPTWKLQFVGHSMGNMVVRRWIHDRQTDGDHDGWLDRCQAMVMLGPPNQGSQIAGRLGPTGIFSLVTGKGGMQMGPTFDEIAETLATPPFPFAIIAGKVDKGWLQNPLLEGPSDLVVRVDEAKLDGSASFETVPVAHSFLMDHDDVMRRVCSLLDSFAAPEN